MWLRGLYNILNFIYTYIHVCVMSHRPSHEYHILMQFENTYGYAYIGVGKAEQMKLGKYVMIVVR